MILGILKLVNVTSALISEEVDNSTLKFPRGPDQEPYLVRIDSLNSSPGIKSLDLNDLQINEIPNDIDKIDFLENLSLRNNNIKELPKPMFNLSNLYFLQLNKNQIGILPEEIGNLKNLKALHLSENKLSQLPNTISNLQSLLSVSLNDNEFTEFPVVLTKLRNLIYLNLNDNKIKTIPDSIPDLKNSLIMLNLGDNQLTQLPGKMLDFLKLSHLDLHHNKFKIFPSQITTFKNLKNIDLSLNQLTEIPSTIRSLKQLEELNLSQNQIKALPEELFELKKLKVLDLSSNNLTEISPCLKKLNFSVLEKIDLSNNPIGIIPEWFTKKIEKYDVLLIFDNSVFESEFSQYNETLSITKGITSNNYTFNGTEILTTKLPQVNVDFKEGGNNSNITHSLDFFDVKAEHLKTSNTTESTIQIDGYKKFYDFIMANLFWIMISFLVTIFIIIFIGCFLLYRQKKKRIRRSDIPMTKIS